MKSIRISILMIIAIVLSVFKATSQRAVAVSSNAGPGMHIAVIWSAEENEVSYNVYRRTEAETAYPKSSINATPIKVLTDCNTIKSLLITGADSTEWKMLIHALSTSQKRIFSPCNISTVPKKSVQYQRLQAIASTSVPISVVAGWGITDKTVKAGITYYYKIDAMNASGTVIASVGKDIRVTAGTFIPLPAPASVAAEAGDDAIQITWQKVPGATGYIIERSNTFSGTYLRVNESLYPANINNKLNGDTIVPALQGMLDYNRFSLKTGKDTTHLVNSVMIAGPTNGNNYYYKVKAVDLFKRAGAASAAVGPAKPGDKTPPSLPSDITAIPDDNTGSVNVKWDQVVRDVNGHWERPDSTVKFRVYRFTNAENPDAQTPVYLGQFNTRKGFRLNETIDSDPSLRSEFGNKIWWYRIRTLDVAGNLSQWSTAVSATVKDITPPRIPVQLATKGFEDYISVKWKLNSEPDISSYMIYRSLCHLGSWVECLPQDTCRVWQSYNPMNIQPQGEAPKTSLAYLDNKNRLPCPCSGPFVFLGELTQDSLRKAVSAGNFFFDDRTIPSGSPLCYAYWIKAKDISGNLSGNYPIPSAEEIGEIACERLHDLTPPDPALISGLFAMDERIRVEWLGPPSQDIRAYHVYRAEGMIPAREPDLSNFKWVGGMTVELPPTLPAVLTQPYEAPTIASCDRISVQATPWMSQGFFTDKKIEPKKTYWYRVVGIDYDGNETKLEKSAAISTFSFSSRIPDAPVLNNPVIESSPCGVKLTWAPAYDAAKHRGFVVYRSNSAYGNFVPIVTAPLAYNNFTDTNVAKGQTWHYRVAVLLLNGKLSAASTVKSVTL